MTPEPRSADTIAAMETTPGTPHLLTDVRFSVSRKGYDPDEVDNFLERVSAAVAQLQDKLRQATASAESAETRAADAVRNESRLQARIAELESGSGAAPAAVVAPIRSVDPTIDAEQASSVLVMAQRTADATINEARTNAAQMLSESEVEASRILSAARHRPMKQFAISTRPVVNSPPTTLHSMRSFPNSVQSSLMEFLEFRRFSTILLHFESEPRRLNLRPQW